MNSKINVVDSRAPRGAGRAAPRSQDAAGGSTPGAAVPESPQSVHITDTASQLASLAHSLGKLPAVDEARVAGIRQAIEQGSYTPAPQHIAHQLIRMEQLMSTIKDESA